MGHLFRPAIGTRIGFSHSLSFTATLAVPDADWRAVAWSPTLGLFCAVGFGQPIGAGAEAMTSPDGLIWTQQVTPVGGVWNSVVWADSLGLFVAVGTGAPDRVMTSPDGINWTPQVAAAVNNWRSVAWSPELGLLVAVSDNGIAGQNVMTSVDGVNWILQVSADTGLQTWSSVAWAAELTTFVAVSVAGAVGGGGGLERVMSSINGVNWFLREVPVGTSNPGPRCVAWSPKLNLFAALIGSGTITEEGIITSPDGVSWTIRNTPDTGPASQQDWNAIAWSPDQELFAGVCGNPQTPFKRCLSSVDGINWFYNISSINTVTDNQYMGIAWSPALDLFATVARSAASTNFAGTLVAP
jgi:hypothetical protein